MSEMYYRGATVEDFRAELVGKKVVDAYANTIKLDDGTVLQLKDTSDCCPWFSASDVRLIDLSDNVVTNVVKTDTVGEDYRIKILSNATEIAEFDVEGTAGNGHYVHSIDLVVVRKEPSYPLSKWWTPTEMQSRMFELEDLVGKGVAQEVVRLFDAWDDSNATYDQGYRDGYEESMNGVED